jgi:chromosome segregation ATPase
MEVFKRILEQTLAHERNKAAYLTRKAYKKQISILEDTILSLKTKLKSTEGNVDYLGSVVDNLHQELQGKKDEISQLDTEMVMLRNALLEKDKANMLLQQEWNILNGHFLAQTNILKDHLNNNN